MIDGCQNLETLIDGTIDKRQYLPSTVLCQYILDRVFGAVHRVPENLEIPK